jgi:NAD(P)-dependent dehydrogenase (short-subunit alcohol dehydrogenase family)
MASVLVTETAGFIGSHLCEALLSRGHSLAAIDNLDEFYSPALKRENLQGSGSHEHFRFYLLNILSREELQEVLRAERPSVVVHLAARAGVRPSLREPHRFAKFRPYRASEPPRRPLPVPGGLRGALRVPPAAQDVGLCLAFVKANRSRDRDHQRLV